MGPQTASTTCSLGLRALMQPLTLDSCFEESSFLVPGAGHYDQLRTQPQVSLPRSLP